MTPAEIAQAKIDLDKDLTGKADTVGIAFGEEIFKAFVTKGYIKKEKFGALGTALWTEFLPAYDKTHYAFFDWDVGAKKFDVGG
jgi:hypothetical protein